MYVSIHIEINMGEYIEYTYTSTYTCKYTWICKYLCMYLYIHTHTHTHKRIWINQTWTYIGEYACMHGYTSESAYMFCMYRGICLYLTIYKWIYIKHVHI
jgi:hypothetical protein